MLSSQTSSPYSSITLGDGSSIPIHYVVHTNIFTPIKNLLFCDVLVAPTLIKNVIFVCKFTSDNHVSIEFDPFGLFVKDLLTKAEIAQFNSSGDLYSVHGAPTIDQHSSMLTSTDLWHHRLGHPHTAVLSLSLNFLFLVIALVIIW